MARSLTPAGFNSGSIASALARYFEYSDYFLNHISRVDFGLMALKIDRHFIDFPIFEGIDSGFATASLSGKRLQHQSGHSGHQLTNFALRVPK